jgi:hypothetical protein
MGDSRRAAAPNRHVQTIDLDEIDLPWKAMKAAAGMTCSLV